MELDTIFFRRDFLVLQLFEHSVLAAEIFLLNVRRLLGLLQFTLELLFLLSQFGLEVLSDFLVLLDKVLELGLLGLPVAARVVAI